MSYGAGLHKIADDLGLVESEPGFPTGEEYRQWRASLTSWLDGAIRELPAQAKTFLKPHAAFLDWLLEQP